MVLPAGTLHRIDVRICSVTVNDRIDPLSLHSDFCTELGKFSRTDRVGVAIARSCRAPVEARRVAWRGASSPSTATIPCTRLLELAEQLGSLGDSAVQQSSHFLPSGLSCGAKRLVTQRLEVFDALLGGHQLAAQRPAALYSVVLAASPGSVGQLPGLRTLDLKLFDVRQLSVELCISTDAGRSLAPPVESQLAVRASSRPVESAPWVGMPSI